MASESHSMTLAELSEYKKYIMKIVSRLHEENSLSLKQTVTQEGKMAFALEFRAPEWFRELNEDIQEVAFDNLQKIMIERVTNIASEMVCVEKGDKCNCCEHIRKRARY